MKKLIISTYLFLISSAICGMDNPQPLPNQNQGDTLSNLYGMHDAIETGNFHRVKDIIEQHPEIINSKKSFGGGRYSINGGTPLHWAAKFGRIAIAQYLLDHGADINNQAFINNRPTENTPLMETTDPQMAEFLLQKRANINAKDLWGGNIFHRIAHRFDELNPELIKLLISKGAHINAKDRDGATPLHAAVQFCNTKTAQLLLDHGANVNVPDNMGRTPLFAIVQGGIDITNGQRQTKEYGDRFYAITKLLIDHNANINAQQKPTKRTALHYVAEMGIEKLARLLLNHGANPFSKNTGKKTPIDLANEHNHFQLAQLMENWSNYKKYRNRQRRAFLSVKNYPELTTHHFPAEIIDHITRFTLSAYDSDSLEEIHALAECEQLEQQFIQNTKLPQTLPLQAIREEFSTTQQRILELVSAKQEIEKELVTNRKRRQELVDQSSDPEKKKQNTHLYGETRFEYE